MPLSNASRTAPLAALAVSAALATEGIADTYNGYEIPEYRVEAQHGAFELRRYAPYLVAEVTVAGNRNQSASRGFRALAGYIFGGNATGQKISMTAPVAQTPVDDGYHVRFALPAKLERAALPAPNSPAVRFVELGATRQAVLQFSGWWTQGKLDAREAELRDWMARAGLEAEGPVLYYFYNDPFTVPWKRRNEVALVVAD